MAPRPATAADLPAIEALVEAAYGPWVERIGMRPGPMRTDYAAALESSEVSVEESGGEIVGLLILLAEPDALWIENVAVAPKRQGEGLYERLGFRRYEAREESGFARVFMQKVL